MATFDFESNTRYEFAAGNDFAIALERLNAEAESIAKSAIYEGAKVVADAMNKAIDNIPEDKFRFLKSGEKISSVTESEKKDLKESFGITPISPDSWDGWNAKIGFDGYGSTPTKKYPKGVPNQLVARAIESGSSVRTKYPFVRNTVNRTKKEAVEAMDKTVDEEIKKLMG